MKIIIIGAGIAGLTLALACQKAKIEVVVYEKAKQLQTIGGGIILWPHGMHYLRELGVADHLQTSLTSVRRMNVQGHRGNAIFSEDHANLYRLLQGEIYPVDRYLLQARMVELLNPGVLQLNKAVQQVRQHTDYAEVIAADGSIETADLVIGADGIRSVVREAMFPEIKPSYSGFCWWGGLVDQAIVPHFNENEVQFILGTNKHCYVWPIQGKRFMWYLPVKMPLSELANAEARIQQAEKLAEEWHEDVVRLVLAPQVAQRFHLPIYEMPPLQQLAKGRFVVIGDAACAFGPLLGQGANKAIEDAYVLSQLLSHQHAVTVINEQFSTLRYERHQRFYALEQQSAAALMYDTVPELLQLEAHFPTIDLATMYQDMIPLVNQAAISGISARR